MLLFLQAFAFLDLLACGSAPALAAPLVRQHDYYKPYHGYFSDLAARNVLISKQTLDIKISDFGLSRQMKNENDIYSELKMADI